MTKYTLQESCDYAVKAMVAQGGQCVNDRDNCSYRNDDDENNITHCAVGHIMKLWGESEDSPAWFTEAGLSVVLRDVTDSSLRVFLEHNEYVLGILQSFHDSITNYKRESRLHRLTYENNIDTSGEHWQQWLNMGDTK